MERHQSQGHSLAAASGQSQPIVSIDVVLMRDSAIINICKTPPLQSIVSIAVSIEKY